MSLLLRRRLTTSSAYFLQKVLFPICSHTLHSWIEKQEAMATSLAAMTARRAVTFARLSSPGSAARSASLIPRRGLAGAAGSRLNLIFPIDPIVFICLYFIFFCFNL